MALLTEESAASADEQLVLPLDDDNSLQEDDEPGSILAAPGLANAADERRWLEHVSRLHPRPPVTNRKPRGLSGSLPA